VLWMGVYPESFLAPIRRDVATIVARVERAAPPGDSALKDHDKTTARFRVKGEHGGDHENKADAKAQGNKH
jgi:NADH-quinone oxidoreductase subunit M